MPLTVPTWKAYGQAWTNGKDKRQEQLGMETTPIHPTYEDKQALLEATIEQMWDALERYQELRIAVAALRNELKNATMETYGNTEVHEEVRTCGPTDEISDGRGS
jgi:hypothetical protein